LQAEIAALVAEGRVQNVLLLLEHPPVLTLGRNAIARIFWPPTSCSPAAASPSTRSTAAAT
jgi:lipoate-protein ligase B